jgi:nitrogenase molybdenum-iron protein alpha chain
MNLDQFECASRENRLGSITCYAGTMRDLVGKARCGRLQKGTRCFNTTGQCSHFDAVDHLSVVEGAVVIDHAPAGCSTGHIMWNSFGRRVASVIGKTPKNVIVVSTNMDESDTVFGSVEKLRQAILFANRRHHPKVIFVTGSCVSAIIAEDIQSVIEELQDEIGVPIAYASCEGIRSKMWSSGFDAAQHAMSKALLKPPREKSNTVNFIVFWPTIQLFLNPALEALGLEPLFISGYATPEDYARASQSVATVGQCGVLTSYLGGALEEKYNVPFIREHFPYGIDGFESWYRQLAALVGKQGEAEDYIKSQREKYLPEIESLREKLSGKRAVIALGPGMAFEFIKILRDLGMNVVHAVGYHFDPILDGGTVENSPVAVYARDAEDLDVSIGDAQQHEFYKIVKKYGPDVIISRGHGSNIWAARLGAATVEYSSSAHCLYAYAGLIELGHKILDELGNGNMLKIVRERWRSPFTPEFEEQDAFAYLRREER